MPIDDAKAPRHGVHEPVAFSFGASMLALLVFGIAPAIMAWRSAVCRKDEIE